MNVIWNVFDKEAETHVSTRNLPHWDQTGAVTFVTLRLADSMPHSVVQKWHNEVQQWLQNNGLENRSVDSVLSDPLVSTKAKQELKKFKHRRWHGHLDDCHGRRPLRNPKLAHVVLESILHFNGTRYDLERLVVMPNHLHLLIQMRTGFQLRKQLTEFMRFSGRKTNKILNRNGPFWQSEPFDHIVRSEEQFHYLRNYILENPAKAKLRAGEFLFWVHDSESRAT